MKSITFPNKLGAYILWQKAWKLAVITKENAKMLIARLLQANPKIGVKHVTAIEPRSLETNIFAHQVYAHLYRHTYVYMKSTRDVFFDSHSIKKFSASLY